MIALIKIRCKYLSNHRCSVFFSYFFIPIILFIPWSIFLLSSPNNRSKFKEKNKFEGKAFNVTKKLFSQNFTFSIENFSLVSDDEKDKTIMQDLIKSDIEWSNNEINFNRENNIIKIINNNEKYKIDLIQSIIFPIFDPKIFDNSYFDLFNPPNEIRNLRFDYFNEFNKFIELQFLFS